jgi:hypothetical protein
MSNLEKYIRKDLPDEFYVTRLTLKELKEMQSLDNEYWNRLQHLEDLTDKLKQEIQENDLPDQLDAPESDEDGLRVNNFANRIYDLGCDITDISEKLMVGRGVQENYNDKREDDIINPYINKDNYL